MDGLKDGATDDGRKVGIAEGLLVDVTVGDIEGILVTSNVGLLVVVNVGAFVGPLVVGDTDVILVGVKVGSEVKPFLPTYANPFSDPAKIAAPLSTIETLTL